MSISRAWPGLLLSLSLAIGWGCSHAPGANSDSGSAGSSADDSVGFDRGAGPDGSGPVDGIGDSRTANADLDATGADAFVACKHDPAEGGDFTEGLVVSWFAPARTFKYHVPATLCSERAVPLVIDLHGIGEGMLGRQEEMSGMRQLSEKEGFIVAWPAGYLGGWTVTATCCSMTTLFVDDVAFIRELVNRIDSKRRIDRKRIYVTGLSAGGALSHALACEASDLIAAIAPVSGPFLYRDLSCTPSRPIAVIDMRGLDDSLVSWDGNSLMQMMTGDIAAESAHREWKRILGCTGSDTTSFSRGQTWCKTNASCRGGVEKTLCGLKGGDLGGHIPYTNEDGVDVAQLIWDHLKKYQR